MFISFFKFKGLHKFTLYFQSNLTQKSNCKSSVKNINTYCTSFFIQITILHVSFENLRCTLQLADANVTAVPIVYCSAVTIVYTLMKSTVVNVKPMI